MCTSPSSLCSRQPSSAGLDAAQLGHRARRRQRRPPAPARVGQELVARYALRKAGDAVDLLDAEQQATRARARPGRAWSARVRAACSAAVRPPIPPPATDDVVLVGHVMARITATQSEQSCACRTTNTSRCAPAPRAARDRRPLVPAARLAPTLSNHAGPRALRTWCCRSPTSAAPPGSRPSARRPCLGG